MNDVSLSELLRKRGLRDTGPRRLVIDMLRRSKKAMSPQDIHRRISAKGSAVNAVTIYRVLQLLTDLHIVHRHPCNGLYTLCSLPGIAGHHGFLHCTSCDGIEEFIDPTLCTLEDGIARKAKFRPSGHVSEITGTCSSCNS